MFFFYPWNMVWNTMGHGITNRPRPNSAKLNVWNVLFDSVTIQLIFKTFPSNMGHSFLFNNHKWILEYHCVHCVYTGMAKTVTHPPNMENIGRFRKVSMWKVLTTTCILFFVFIQVIIKQWYVFQDQSGSSLSFFVYFTSWNLINPIVFNSKWNFFWQSFLLECWQNEYAEHFLQTLREKEAKRPVSTLSSPQVSPFTFQNNFFSFICEVKRHSKEYDTMWCNFRKLLWKSYRKIYCLFVGIQKSKTIFFQNMWLWLWVIVLNSDEIKYYIT